MRLASHTIQWQSEARRNGRRGLHAARLRAQTYGPVSETAVHRAFACAQAKGGDARVHSISARENKCVASGGRDLACRTGDGRRRCTTAELPRATACQFLAILVSSTSPGSIRPTMTAAPITSAGCFSAFEPRSISQRQQPLGRAPPLPLALAPIYRTNSDGRACLQHRH